MKNMEFIANMFTIFLLCRKRILQKINTIFIDYEREHKCKRVALGDNLGVDRPFFVFSSAGGCFRAIH